MYLFELEFSLGMCPGVGLLDHMIVLFLVLFFLLKNSIYLFMAVLGLHCCKQAFSSCGEWGLLSSCSARRLLLWWNMGSRLMGSVVVAHRLQLRLSVVVHGDLPRPGVEPVSPELAGGFLTSAPPTKSPFSVF